MQEPVPSDLIRSIEAATILGVSRSCVVRWGQAGKLRAWMVGGTMRFSEAEVRAFRRPIVIREKVRTAEEDRLAAEAAVRRMGLKGRGATRRR